MESIDSAAGTTPVVVVSGATGGIGQAVAERLARAGAQVALVGRSAQRLEQTRQFITDGRHDLAGRVTAYPADINDATSVDRTVEAIARIHGGIDALVHAAGDGPVASLREADDAMWHTTYNAKLMGAVRLTRAVADPMTRRGGGSIVLVGGAFRQDPQPLFPINSAINAALAAFAKAASKDLGPDGIRVNVIDPGAVDTALWTRTAQDLAERAGTTAAEVTAQIERGTPLGTLTRPDDVAAVACFLLSPAARHLTGTAITVDGGACPGL